MRDFITANEANIISFALIALFFITWGVISHLITKWKEHRNGKATKV
jgi:hypothetical protein